MPSISVIIPTYNRKNFLEKTLVSFLKQSFPKKDYEIVVVDNGCSQAIFNLTQKLANKYKKRVIYLKEPVLGLTKARHTGAKVAKGKILAYADDDAIYPANYLAEIIKPYKDKKVAAVGTKVVAKWEKQPPKWILKYFNNYYYSLLDYGREIKKVNFLNGVSLSIRKELLFKLGGFNPDVVGKRRIGDGESGLMRKIQKTSAKIIYTPRAVVKHIIPLQRISLGYIKKRSFDEGIAVAFADYKKKEVNNLRLIILFFYYFVDFLRELIKSFFYILNKSLKFYLVYSRAYFFLGRLRFIFDFLFDKDYQKLVKKNRWLEYEKS